VSAPIELRDAATVMLVRDDAAGELEVFMLRRSLDSDFVGGAYVFPGGAVDPDDRATDLEPVCEGLTDAEASARLGVLNGDGDEQRGPAHDLYGPMGSGGLAFWVAAIRECFEEAGVLLAHDAGGDLVRLGDPDVARRFAEHRRAVDSGERRLVEICIEEGLRLAVGGIHYFSHWITPVGPPRRYDTRFFLARAPEDQEPLHDDRETIANCWIRPREALERHRRGEFDLILPTIKNLEAIGRFATAEEVLAAAAAVDEVPTVLPRIVEAAGGIRILLPGDPGYDDASSELPAGVPMPGRPGGPALPT
jgi:8-oxo-dGTP pyrophosphatase MutT (NUDIX family)